MNRRQVLASVAAGSIAATGATTIAGATSARAVESDSAVYRITYDDAGERIVQRTTAEEAGVAPEDSCWADCCQYCPPEYVCDVCICHGPCPIK